LFQERLDLIEPEFLTQYTNIYLICGSKKAILFDTGSGSYQLSTEINKIWDIKELIVINSHSHFDHIGSNSEFKEIYIQESELNFIDGNYDLSFLRDSKSTHLSAYQINDFKIKPANKIIPLQGGEVFDLGDYKVTVHHTPGHTPGSICLSTSKRELFTGDTIHYGSIYLPEKKNFEIYQNSLLQLLSLVKKGNWSIFPAHELYNVDKSVIEELLIILDEFDYTNPNSRFNQYLNKFILKSTKFNLIY
ncbi:MAG: MBL fold metallo-hydrolase, partial [Candidatus Heimdallarchaeota archaeon]|nr:MBL fold metallo-hydrolase [Candidatus Heimdallarchaeota archaeon]